uniref:ATP-binding cassette domain-containing protein n=1 Tax=Roseovarius sp. TaxID=1486281 RepID=UPI00356818A5
MTPETPVLSIEGLKIALPEGSDRSFALEGLDLTVNSGEIVCLVGESGSGKSLCAGAVMRLLPEPHVHVAAGAVIFEGKDLLAKTETEMRRVRGRHISMIFQ